MARSVTVQPLAFSRGKQRRPPEVKFEWISLFFFTSFIFFFTGHLDRFGFDPFFVVPVAVAVVIVKSSTIR